MLLKRGKLWENLFSEQSVLYLYCTFGWVKADSCHGIVQPVRQVSPVCSATSPGYEGFIWQGKDKRAGSLTIPPEWEELFSQPLLGPQITTAVFDIAIKSIWHNLHHSWANSEQSEQQQIFIKQQLQPQLGSSSARKKDGGRKQYPRYSCHRFWH